MRPLDLGLAISFEGGEGTGKTSIIEMVAAHLENRGYSVLCSREPGGVRVAEMIRKILLDKEYTEIDARTEALLFAAARRQHLVEKVIPAIEEGHIVLLDRFVDSSIVYQGVSRNIGVDEVWEINKFAIGDFLPKLTILLDIAPNVARTRLLEKNRETDKLDELDLSFHENVREAYLDLARKHPQRIVVVDAAYPIDVVMKNVIAIIESFFNTHNVQNTSSSTSIPIRVTSKYFR